MEGKVVKKGFDVDDDVDDVTCWKMKGREERNQGTDRRTDIFVLDGRFLTTIKLFHKRHPCTRFPYSYHFYEMGSNLRFWHRCQLSRWFFAQFLVQAFFEETNVILVVQNRPIVLGNQKQIVQRDHSTLRSLVRYSLIYSFITSIFHSFFI